MSLSFPCLVLYTDELHHCRSLAVALDAHGKWRKCAVILCNMLSMVNGATASVSNPCLRWQDQRSLACFNSLSSNTIYQLGNPIDPVAATQTHAPARTRSLKGRITELTGQFNECIPECGRWWTACRWLRASWVQISKLSDAVQHLPCSVTCTLAMVGLAGAERGVECRSSSYQMLSSICHAPSPAMCMAWPLAF